MPVLPTLLRRPSRALREADLLARHGRRLVHRRRDLLGATTLTDLDGNLNRLEKAVRDRDEDVAREASEQLDPQLVRLSHHRDEANWRENCEVILMAIVVAVAVRAYFFQPFKIPTGSMQPTLNGIVARSVAADKPGPGAVRGFFEGLFLGRSFLELRAVADDQIRDFREYERPLFGFLSFYKQTGTKVICESGRVYDAALSFGNVPVAALDGIYGSRVKEGTFGLHRGQTLRAGEVFLRGYIETGDQVFVDKLTYHFRAPRRDDVFVFRTTGITGIPMNDPNVRSQFYIKRLAGIPGDTLRIAAPELFINGPRADGYGYRRVMSGAREQPNEGYRGYANIGHLGTPADTFTAPSDGYIALGDNSYNSLDSRFWGPVPARNLVGRGLFVYWPFTRHWGLIR